MKKKYITPCAETCCTMSTPLLDYSVHRFKDGGKKTVGSTEEKVKQRNTLWNP